MDAVFSDFFASGRAADVMLLVLAAEALWLKYRGWKWLNILGLLGPAILIVIGLRSALTGAHWIWVVIPLALSFPVHLLDLRLRPSQRKAD